MKQRSLFRSVLIICLAISVLVPAVSIYVIHPVFRNYVYDIERNNSIRLANHLKGNVVDGSGELKDASVFRWEVEQLRQDIGIQVIRVYDADGVVIYSEDGTDIGTKISHPAILNSVARKKNISMLDASKSFSAEGDTLLHNVVKTYVPIMKGDRYLGALEMHNDVTGPLHRLETLLHKLAIIPIAFMTLFCAIIWHLIGRVRNDVSQIEQLYMTDGLTGLLNRRTLMEKLIYETGSARRYQHPLSLIMCDVDDFKKINDTYGHQIGDEALKNVSAALRSLLRATDIVGRYGGDEFLVILPESGREGAAHFASRLMAAVRAENVSGLSTRIELTLSIGMAVMVPGAPVSAEELLRLADGALYEAKKCGKDCFKAASSVYVEEPEPLLEVKAQRIG
ncbi:MAG: GGDEF domain-containing protein [Nitrospirota bacterium]